MQVTYKTQHGSEAHTLLSGTRKYAHCVEESVFHFCDDKGQQHHQLQIGNTNYPSLETWNSAVYVNFILSKQ